MNGRFGRRFTNNGLWFESPDKVFQFHVGGRTQMDSSFFTAGNTVQYGPKGIGKLRDGVDPRRMRIRLEGAMYENMLFVMEYDFINTATGQGTNFGQATGADRVTSVSNTPAIGTARPARPLGRLPEHPLHRPHPRRLPEGAVRVRAVAEQPVPQLHGAFVQPGRLLLAL